MSHDLRRRGSCIITIWILLLHFDQSCDSTRRDGEGRWLWRLVGPLAHVRCHSMVRFAANAGFMIFPNHAASIPNRRSVSARNSSKPISSSPTAMLSPPVATPNPRQISSTVRRSLLKPMTSLTSSHGTRAELPLPATIVKPSSSKRTTRANRGETGVNQVMLFCPTSKMSHDLRRRGSCCFTTWILLLHFDQPFDSTRRDGEGCWLWRLVRPIFHSRAAKRSRSFQKGQCGHASPPG